MTMAALAPKCAMLWLIIHVSVMRSLDCVPLTHSLDHDWIVKTRRETLNQMPAFLDIAPFRLAVANGDTDDESSANFCGREQATAVRQHFGQDSLVFFFGPKIAETDRCE